MQRLGINIIVLFLFTSISTSVIGQGKMGFYRFGERWGISGDAGSVLFYGDVAEFVSPLEKEAYEYKWAFGGRIKKDLTPVLSIQGQFLSGKLTGIRDIFSSGWPANERFETDFFEYNGALTFDILNLFTTDIKRFSVYGIGGVGVVNFRGKMLNSVTDSVIYSVGYEDNGLTKASMKTAMVYPFGLGAGFAISKNFYVNLDATYRWVNSDELDARVGITEIYDIYGFTALGLTYKFNFVEPRQYPPDDVVPDYITKNNTTTTTTTDDNDNTSGNITIDENANQTTNDYNTETTTDYNTETTTTTDYTPDDQNTTTTNDYIPDNQTTTTDNNLNNSGLSFRVQIAASKTQMNKDQLKAKYGISDDIQEDNIPPFFRYTIGSFSSIEEANNYKNKVRRENGVMDAFVVPYKEGNRIKLSVAYNLLKAQSSSSAGAGFIPPTQVFSSTLNNEIKRNNLFYTVQVAASKNELPGAFFNEKNIPAPIYHDYVDGWHKYSIGSYANFSEANNIRRNVATQYGIEGAFVVAYMGNQRISAYEANKMIKSGNVSTQMSQAGFADATSVVNNTTNGEILKNRVYFSVQVAASAKPLNESFFSNKDLSETIYHDYVEGWNKYSVGVFSSFQEANQYRNKIASQTGINEAFVVGYENQRRISAGEARKIILQNR